jgi:hypothetical protein
MAITGNCPGCGHPFRFPDSAHGQSARCKTCGERFRVLRGAVDDVPEPPDPPKPKQSNVSKGFSLGFGAFFGLIAAGVVLVLACVICLVAITALGTSANATFGTVGPTAIPVEAAPEKTAIRKVELVKVELIEARIALPRIKIGEHVLNPDDLSDAAGGPNEYYRRTGTKRLLVKVRVTNITQSRLVRLSGWGRSSNWLIDGRPSLSDEHGNHYAAFRKGDEVEYLDQIDGASLEPGQSVDDLIVFESPLKEAKQFVLTLPRSHVDEAKEDWTFQFTRDQLGRR